MSRTRASAKKAGARFERLVADYLAEHVDERIDRRVKTGANDRGDIAGLRHMAARIVVECKDYGGRINAGEWLTEAEIERGNDDAMAAVVVAKRRGKPDPADQLVMMSLADFVALLIGDRPHIETPVDSSETDPWGDRI